MDDAIDLIETARDVLVNRLIAQLPASEKYHALMVANAMAIAARSVACPALSTPDPSLSKAIRRGVYDPGTIGHEAMAVRLLTETRARCAVSNPKALAIGR